MSCINGICNMANIVTQNLIASSNNTSHIMYHTNEKQELYNTNTIAIVMSIAILCVLLTCQRNEISVKNSFCESFGLLLLTIIGLFASLILWVSYPYIMLSFNIGVLMLLYILDKYHRM